VCLSCNKLKWKLFIYYERNITCELFSDAPERFVAILADERRVELNETTELCSKIKHTMYEQMIDTGTYL